MSNWIDELSRRRLRSKLAGVLYDDKYGWNIGHAGIMEPIHREWADSQADLVLRVLDEHFSKMEAVNDC